MVKELQNIKQHASENLILIFQSNWLLLRLAMVVLTDMRRSHQWYSVETAAIEFCGCRRNNETAKLGENIVENFQTEAVNHYTLYLHLWSVTHIFAQYTTKVWHKYWTQQLLYRIVILDISLWINYCKPTRSALSM